MCVCLCVFVCVCLYIALWQLYLVRLDCFMYTLPECVRIPGTWQHFNILNCQSFFFLIYFGHSINMLSCLSHVWLFAVLCTVAHQAPLSIRFSRQKYWSGLPCPPSGDLPDPGIEPVSLVYPALPVGSFPTEPSGKSFGHFSRFETVTVWLCAPLSNVWVLHLLLILAKNGCD